MSDTESTGILFGIENLVNADKMLSSGRSVAYNNDDNISSFSRKSKKSHLSSKKHKKENRSVSGGGEEKDEYKSMMSSSKKTVLDKPKLPTFYNDNHSSDEDVTKQLNEIKKEFTGNIIDKLDFYNDDMKSNRSGLASVSNNAKKQLNETKKNTNENAFNYNGNGGVGDDSEKKSKVFDIKSDDDDIKIDPNEFKWDNINNIINEKSDNEERKSKNSTRNNDDDKKSSKERKYSSDKESSVGYNKKSNINIIKEKIALLAEYDRIKKGSSGKCPEFTKDDDVDDIKFEIERLKFQKTRDRNIQFMRTGTEFFTLGVEKVLETFGVSTLSGWSTNVKMNIYQFDSVFDELLDKYTSEGGSSLPPELRFVMLLGMSGAMYAGQNKIPKMYEKMMGSHMQNKMSMPDVGDDDELHSMIFDIENK